MSNFVKDNTSLPFPKTLLRGRPAGSDPANYISATEWNTVCQGVVDLRGYIKAADWFGLTAQAADPAPSGIDNYIWLKNDGTLWKTVGGVAEEIGAGGSGDITELRIAPEGPWYEGVGSNLPAGQVNNYNAHPHLQTRTILVVKGADNQGTTFTGIDSTGIQTGDIRIFMDNQPVGMQDCGNIIFKHEHPDSLPQNRFMCPGQYDYNQPPNGMTLLIYGEDSRWHVFGVNGRYTKVITESLQLYPKILLGRDNNGLAPISGAQNDWDPVGWAGMGGFGLAGSDSTFKNHSAIEIITDISGATISGFNVQSAQADPAYYGALKFILNRGPGDLTILDQGAGSQVQNRIHTPNAETLVLKPGEAMWIFYGYPDPDTTQPQWRVVALAQGRSSFPTLTATGRLTAKTLTLGPQVSPVALAAGLTSNWNPGSGAVIKATTASPGSYIDGLVPEDSLNGNEIRIIRNTGPSPLYVFDDLYSASQSDNRFSLPSTYVVVIPVSGELAVQYQPTLGKWVCLGAPMRIQESSLTIIPAGLAGTNINDYTPTDNATGLPGRLAAWWQVSGTVGTVLTGINAAPAGLPAFRAGDEVLVTNMGSGMVVSHGNANSVITNRFFLSGGANITLSQFGSVRFKYTGGTWLMITKP